MSSSFIYARNTYGSFFRALFSSKSRQSTLRQCGALSVRITIDLVSTSVDKMFFHFNFISVLFYISNYAEEKCMKANRNGCYQHHSMVFLLLCAHIGSSTIYI